MSTKVTGSAFGDFQAYFEYELSSTNTTYTIKVINAGFKQNCTYATYPWKTTMTATSYDSRSGTDATATTDKGYHSVLEADKSYTYTKKTSSYTVTIKATTKKNIDGGSSGSVSKTFTIPALTKYTITYNANGGSGAPGNTYQYYGIAAALSSTKPTRTGYTFLGWSTSSTATSATWAAGGSYKANASDTLYAVWKAVTCTVTFNANGGVAGSVTSKAKTYGKSITLPTKAESPTRQYYNFLGWSTSSTATSATWAAGATYSVAITSNTTLYAVWEKAYVPAKFSKPVALRVDDENSQDDEGLWGQVSFTWTHGTMEGENVTPSSIVVYVRETGTSTWYEAYSVEDFTVTSINTGKFQCNGEALLLESQYDIKVVLTDNYNSANPLTVTAFISKAEFIIDVNAKGTSVSIGEAASDDEDEDETFNVRWKARFKNHVYLTNGKYFYVNNASGVPRIMMSSNASNQYTFGNGSYINSEGSVYYDGNSVDIRSKSAIAITSPTAGLTARHYGVNKVLWSGGMYMLASQTITLSEAVSAQPHGIVLAFSDYTDGVANNFAWNYFFVPKYAVSKGRMVVHMHTGALFGRLGSKNLYIYNTSIVGHADNASTGTGSSVNYVNNRFVLRYVIGV